LIEQFRLEELQPRHEQLGAQQQGQHPALQQHGKREDKVHGTDVFVVGGEHPATPALFGAVVRVVVIVIVGGRWNVTGGNAAHAWLLPAGPPVGGGPYSVILLRVTAAI